MRFGTDDVAKVALLSAQAERKWLHTVHSLKVKLPDDKPCHHACALKIIAEK